MSAVDLGRGLVLPNRVGLASGTAGYGFELEQLVDINRLGALYTKGTTRLARPGNAPPRIAETAQGMINSIGLHNPGVDHVAGYYAEHFARWRIPVIVNVAGAGVEDYVHCARRLEGIPGIAGIELNISCPNIAHGLDFGRDPRAAAEVTAAVRSATSLCVIVKLSPNVTDIGAVAAAVAGAGADAVSAVNTYVGMKVHRDTLRPVLPAGTGGLSGPAIKPLALAAVAQVRAAVSIPVIAAGGISGPDDALEFLAIGASAVQVGTATFVDPSTALRVLDGLTRYEAADRPEQVSSARLSVPPVGIEPTSTG